MPVVWCGADLSIVGFVIQDFAKVGNGLRFFLHRSMDELGGGRAKRRAAILSEPMWFVRGAPRSHVRIQIGEGKLLARRGADLVFPPPPSTGFATATIGHVPGCEVRVEVQWARGRAVVSCGNWCG